jgi:dihydroorotase-like cyclic amidohydrolase
VHCEDEALTADTERALRDSGREDNGVIIEWRNRDAELASLAVTMLLAARTGAHVVAAHVSNPEGLELVRHYRAQGATVGAESCPQYLMLREDEILEHGAFRKFTPPARAHTQDELDEMWKALNAGTIDYISTDHAPATAAQKTAGSIWDVHFGLPGIDTTLPLLLDAAARGATTYERVVEAYSEMPARTYGFYPRKGSLDVGADADLVLVDPDGDWTIADADVVSKAGWSPFAGRTVRGRVRQTYLRGQLAAEDRVPSGEPGSGRFLPGRGAQART